MLPARPWPGLLAYTNFVGLSSAVFRREAGHLPYFHEAVEGIIHEDYGFWLRYMRDFKPVLSFAPESWCKSDCDKILVLPTKSRRYDPTPIGYGIIIRTARGGAYAGCSE